MSCIIRDNVTPAVGGGFYLGPETTGNGWSPVISDNRISRNVAAGTGGGIFVSDLMTPEITGNIISENKAVSGDGGGIFYRGRYDGGIIRDNVITDNVAGDKGGGILIASLVQFMSVEISWNLIAGNRSESGEQTGNSGGGIKLTQTNAWVHHNTIVNNAGYGTTYSQGGGIVAYFGGNPTIEKNIIALSQVGGGIWCDAATTPIIRNNLAWQNSGGDGVGACPTWWQTDGNIVTDPHFCNPESGDYSLAQNSPALTHPFGPLGAFHLPGCGPVSVEPTTWGRIKTLYDR
jgi:parallel beta-helix repeat protein